MRIGVLLLCGILCGSIAGAEELAVISSFNEPNDPNDGWTAAQIQFGQPLIVYGSVPLFHDPNGNPGGCIGTYDDTTVYNCFVAPAKFLGDKSAFLGGTLTFDLRQTPQCADEEGWCRADEIAIYIRSMVDGNEIILHSFQLTPKDPWTPYSVRLSPADGNFFGPDLEPALFIDINGSAVTPALADVQAVLANIQAIYIIGDYIRDEAWPGSETAYLDNVQMRSNYVDFDDLVRFAAQWQRNDCILSDWCAGQDFTRNGAVDLADLQYVIDSWLGEMPY